MKTETITIYKCDHCNKLYQIQKFAIAHEPRCKKNPDNIRPCHDCVFLDMVEEILYEDSGYGEVSRKLNVLYCKKKEHFIYPPRTERNGNAFDFGHTSNKPMPRQCDEQKSHLKL